MRKQTYFNQGFKGRAFHNVTRGERGQLIAAFDVMFGLSLRFDTTAWKHARSIAPLSISCAHTHSHEKLLKGLRVLSAVIFIKSLLLLPVGPPLNFNLQPFPVCITETQTWQRWNLRIRFIILWMNVHGHATVSRLGYVGPESTIHLSLSLLKYKLRLDPKVCAKLSHHPTTG